MLKRMVRGWMGGNFHLWTSTKTKNNNIHFLLLSSLDWASTNFKNWFKLNAASICDSVRVSLKWSHSVGNCQKLALAKHFDIFQHLTQNMTVIFIWWQQFPKISKTIFLRFVQGICARYNNICTEDSQKRIITFFLDHVLKSANNSLVKTEWNQIRTFHVQLLSQVATENYLIHHAANNNSFTKFNSSDERTFKKKLTNY